MAVRRAKSTEFHPGARRGGARAPAPPERRELASHLTYPKVFEDYTGNRRRYGRVSVLPTPAFFSGLEPGREIDADIEAAKTLIISYPATSDADEEGQRTIWW